MRITKAMLAKLGIHNPYNIAQAVGNKIYIEYIPADNGRLTSRYAFWKFIRLEGERIYTREFTVTHREAKEPALQAAIAYVENRYKINMTDTDVWGNYHPEGTLAKLMGLYKQKA